MLRKSLPWSIRQVCNMIDKGTITFDSPVQRPANQWKPEDKSLLIHSLLTMFVPDIYAIQVKTEIEGKNINIYDIVDGKQRLTTISSFLKDQWTLTDLESVKLESTGESFNISGKLFSELPSEVQEEIKAYTITFKAIELEEDDDEENIVDDIFYRLNNGKAVSKEHMALVAAKRNVQEFTRRIISEHPLFTTIAKFSENAIKKSDKEITVLQSILLVSGLDYASFATKDIEQVFAKSDITDHILALTEKSFDAIAEAFPEIHKFVTKINISAMAYIFSNSVNYVETTKKLLQYVNKDTKPGDGYKKYTGAGNVKKDKTIKRINALMELCGVFIKPIELIAQVDENQEYDDITPEVTEGTLELTESQDQTDTENVA